MVIVRHIITKNVTKLCDLGVVLLFCRDVKVLDR
jgi:hypothetical protein